MITDIFTIILQVIIPMAIVIGLLLQAIKITKKMSGEAGALAIKYAKTFAAGPIARNTIGRAASLIGKSEIAKNTLGSKWGRRFGGRYISQGLKNVESESFGGAKGGYKGAVEGKAKKQEEFGKYLGEGDATAGAARQKAYAESLAYGKDFAQYTGIGAAAQKAAPKVERMKVKTERKAKRQADAEKNRAELKDLQDQKIPEIIPKDIEALEEINKKLENAEAARLSGVGTKLNAEQQKELLHEKAIIENKQKHHDRIKELQDKEEKAKEREEQTEDFEDMKSYIKNLKKEIKKEIKEENKDEK